jgi:hypothetical protein
MYDLSMLRSTGQLWLDVLRPPSGFALSSLTLALAGAEALRARGPGEVKKPETLNYRTLLPERDGLFCEVTFGKGPIERGPFADDELVTEPRATRFGRIVLPAPIVHPLALAHAPDEVAERAGISRDELDALARYSEPEQWARLGELLARTAQGAAVLIQEVLVLPPYLRPIKKIDGDRWVTSDINDLYRRVVNRVNRLRRLREMGAPAVLVSNEHSMIAEAIRALFENEVCPKPMTDPQGRTLASVRTLGVGNRLFEALAILDRRKASGGPIDGPLPRTLHHPIAALHAMGFELGP